jgi:hypothetical protein
MPVDSEDSLCHHFYEKRHPGENPFAKGLLARTPFPKTHNWMRPHLVPIGWRFTENRGIFMVLCDGLAIIEVALIIVRQPFAGYYKLSW